MMTILLRFSLGTGFHVKCSDFELKAYSTAKLVLEIGTDMVSHNYRCIACAMIIYLKSTAYFGYSLKDTYSII